MTVPNFMIHATVSTKAHTDVHTLQERKRGHGKRQNNQQIYASFRKKNGHFVWFVLSQKIQLTHFQTNFSYHKYTLPEVQYYFSKNYSKDGNLKRVLISFNQLKELFWVNLLKYLLNSRSITSPSCITNTKSVVTMLYSILSLDLPATHPLQTDKHKEEKNKKLI